LEKKLGLSARKLKAAIFYFLKNALDEMLDGTSADLTAPEIIGFDYGIL